MTTWPTLLLGAGIGVGLLVILRAFRDRRAPLADLVRTLSSTGASVAELGSAPGDDITGRARTWAVGLIDGVGFGDAALLRLRLRVLGKSMEQHAFEKLMAMVAGFALPLLLAVVMAAAGLQPPTLLLLLAAFGLAVGGFVYPDVPLAEQVEERRRSFRHALGAYLELVCVMLAGGAGTQTALAAAAESGGGWAFAELRRALHRAAATNRPPAELFDELGIELGVEELRDLASSLALAGGHGARVKESLIAKSDAMRHTLVTDLESMAETRTEKMIVPVAIMTVGLTLFVGYAAVTAIAGGNEVVQTGFTAVPEIESP